MSTGIPGNRYVELRPVPGTLSGAVRWPGLTGIIARHLLVIYILATGLVVFALYLDAAGPETAPVSSRVAVLALLLPIGAGTIWIPSRYLYWKRVGSLKFGRSGNRCAPLQAAGFLLGPGDRVVPEEMLYPGLKLRSGRGKKSLLLSRGVGEERLKAQPGPGRADR